MKRYYMFNFAETKKVYIGEFLNDDEFWKHYLNNESKIKEQQSKLDIECKIWHMTSF
jgi:hypothetical protein